MSQAVRRANKASAAELSQSLESSSNFMCEVRATSDLSADERAAIWATLQDNMQDMYVDSSWGWDPAAKQEELFHTYSRFILARNQDVITNDTTNEAGQRPIIAYVMFRFDREEDEDVAYCYELQVCKDMRRSGLGRFLMHQLQSISTRWHMEKVMLTVFKHNSIARQFYTRLGFEVDETSPEYEASDDAGNEDEDEDGLTGEGDDEEEYDYEILSLSLPRT